MKFYWPVQDVDPAAIPAGYKFAVARGSITHPGLDMGKLNDKVYAAAGGAVSAAGWAASGEGGVLVYIDHGRGYQTRYFHLNPALDVKKGDTVAAGQRLGRASTTGIKNSPAHLHFEIRYSMAAPAARKSYACKLTSSDGQWYLCDPSKLLRYAVPLGLITVAVAAGWLLVRAM